jgi:hypothetical protein
MQKEYNATQTHSKSCYKTLTNYTIKYRDEQIYAPTPVTINPIMFTEMKPYNIVIKSNNNFNCSGYSTLNKKC